MRAARVLIFAILAVAASLPPPSAGQEKEKWCSRVHARHLVHDFIRSYNTGAFTRLDRLFGKEDNFAFYRLWPEREWPSSEDRDGLIPYFRERHEHGDHFELVAFRINEERGDSPRNIWGFSYVIARSSDDPMPWGNGTLSGKGAADCTIYAWNATWNP